MFQHYLNNVSLSCGDLVLLLKRWAPPLQIVTLYGAKAYKFSFSGKCCKLVYFVQPVLTRYELVWVIACLRFNDYREPAGAAPCELLGLIKVICPR